MPNHVTSVFTVSGTPEDLIKFKSRFFVDKDDKKHFDFNTVIPMPEAMKEGELWYRWSIDNWGTKWNSYDSEIKTDAPEKLVFKFETAWNYPQPIMAKVCEEFPDLKIETKFFDEGWNFAGHGFAGDPVMTEADEELYEEVYGEKYEGDE